MAESSSINLHCQYTGCQFVSTKIEKIKDHTYLKHSSDANFSLKCCYQTCNLIFKSSKIFLKHLNICHANNENTRAALSAV